MIINIRGTSGSGKSTLVRQLMELYEQKSAYKEEGRKQPIGYVCSNPLSSSLPLAVIGHYETACGGCDTISKMEHIFDLVRKSHQEGFDVVFEGLLISADVNRTLALHQEGLPLAVVALDQVPIEVCLSSVNERRMARLGPEKYTPVKEKNTISKFRGVQKSMERLRVAGVTVVSCDRDLALSYIKGVLGHED